MVDFKEQKGSNVGQLLKEVRKSFIAKHHRSPDFVQLTHRAAIRSFWSKYPGHKINQTRLTKEALSLIKSAIKQDLVSEAVTLINGVLADLQDYFNSATIEQRKVVLELKEELFKQVCNIFEKYPRLDSAIREYFDNVVLPQIKCLQFAKKSPQEALSLQMAEKKQIKDEKDRAEKENAKLEAQQSQAMHKMMKMFVDPNAFEKKVRNIIAETSNEKLAEEVKILTDVNAYWEYFGAAEFQQILDDAISHPHYVESISLRPNEVSGANVNRPPKISTQNNPNPIDSERPLDPDSPSFKI